MKVLFMGTPDLAMQCLRAVYNKDGVEIVGAVTQPDRQKGRGIEAWLPAVCLHPSRADGGVIQDEWSYHREDLIC